MPMFVIGRNEWALALNEHLHFEAVVDDFYPHETWHGLSVLSLSAVPLGATIVNAVTSISPHAGARRLAERSDLIVLAAADVVKTQDSLPCPDFVTDMRSSLSRHGDAFSWTRSLFEDEESRDIWDRLIAFRSSADISCMSPFSVRLKDQYFESFAVLPENGIFVDCGGFDGDTSEELSKRYPWHGRIHLFEPDPENLLKARQRLKNLPDVVFHQLGVSDASGALYFDAGSGSASAVSSSGSHRIDVITLDEAIKEKVHFIKMDLEGWELNALAGASDLVRSSHPILALAVYHQADHFWKIPAMVMSMRTDYLVYLRHYTEGWSESVMYFVPADRDSSSRKAIPSLA